MKWVRTQTATFVFRNRRCIRSIHALPACTMITTRAQSTTSLSIGYQILDVSMSHTIGRKFVLIRRKFNVRKMQFAELFFLRIAFSANLIFALFFTRHLSAKSIIFNSLQAKLTDFWQRPDRFATQLQIEVPSANVQSCYSPRREHSTSANCRYFLLSMPIF